MAEQLCLRPDDRVLHRLAHVHRLARQIRRVSDVPIMFVSVVNQKEKIVEGLKIGADDYVTKPFDSGELRARVEAVMRRAGRSGQASSYSDGYLTVNLADHPAYRDTLAKMRELLSLSLLATE